MHIQAFNKCEKASEDWSHASPYNFRIASRRPNMLSHKVGTRMFWHKQYKEIEERERGFVRGQWYWDADFKEGEEEEHWQIWDPIRFYLMRWYLLVWSWYNYMQMTVIVEIVFDDKNSFNINDGYQAFLFQICLILLLLEYLHQSLQPNNLLTWILYSFYLHLIFYFSLHYRLITCLKIMTTIVWVLWNQQV